MPHLNKKIIALLLSAAVLISCLLGCAPKAPEPVEETPTPTAGVNIGDGRFTLNCDHNYAFNPMTTPNVSNQMVAQLMYDTLYEMGTEFTPSARLITEIDTADGIRWTFTVDEGVTFWDGSPMTAYDVVYSIKQAMRSNTYKARLAAIGGISVIDAEKYAITLGYANMQLPSLLNIPVIKDGEGDLSVPMGTGPYKPNEDMTQLTAYEGYKYYDKLPIETIYLDSFDSTEELIYAFDNGEIDLTTNDPNSSMNLGFGASNETRYYNTTNMNFIGFNCESRFFSNPLFRRAMTYVVDREKIVSDCMRGAGLAATLPVSPAASIYNNSYSDMISYSRKKSEAALDEAQVQDYDDDGFREIMITGIPVEINIDFIVCTDSPNKVEAARLVADNLKSLGIKLELRELGFSEYKNNIASGDYDMFYGEVKLTGDFNIRQMVFSGGSLNYGSYKDAALESYVSAYLASTDEGRQAAADLMFKYVTDSAPFVTVCFEKMQAVTHKGVVTGLKPTQYNVFHEIGGWTITLDD